LGCSDGIGVGLGVSDLVVVAEVELMVELVLELMPAPVFFFLVLDASVVSAVVDVELVVELDFLIESR
jgi:hypothetical protein